MKGMLDLYLLGEKKKATYDFLAQLFSKFLQAWHGLQQYVVVWSSTVVYFVQSFLLNRG